MILKIIGTFLKICSCVVLALNILFKLQLKLLVIILRLHPQMDLWSNSPHPTNVRQPSLLAYGVTRHHGSQIPVPSQSLPVTQYPTPSCVNVQVENHRLAIYVQNPSLTIGWLAEEAAKRYKRLLLILFCVFASIISSSSFTS